MVTLGSLVDSLNSMAQSPNFKEQLKGVKTHGDFHALVSRFAVPLLPLGLIFATWRIKSPSIEDSEIISYNRNFTAHKNSRSGDRGNFSDLSFYIKEGMERSFTLEQAELFIKRLYTTNRIAAMEKSIEDSKQELADRKKWLAELKQELRALPKVESLT